MLILIGIVVSCGGTTYYWKYTQNEASSHIEHAPLIPVWVDGTFTPAEMQEIKAAVTEWNYALNGQMRIYVVEKKALGSDKQMHYYPDGFLSWEQGKELQKNAEKTGLGWVVFNTPSNSAHYEKDTDEGVLAFVHGVGHHAVFVISDRFGSRSMKDVMMHEFAHLLGARHVNAPSLEYPIYSKDQYSCIDKITVAQVANEHGLDLNTLNYCVTPHFE